MEIVNKTCATSFPILGLLLLSLSFNHFLLGNFFMFVYNPPNLGFSSGGLKRNSQNPDTMEAKTVKTKIKTQFGKKWVKSAISWHNFERL